MSDAALVELAGVVKRHIGPQPLRVARLRVAPGDRVAIAGLDAASAETLVHLITGAALPDEGDVLIAGTSTRAIVTDTAWLASLDRFGLVTGRAVLLDKLTIADNLALPLTLSIDPVPPSVLPDLQRIADEVGLGRDRLGSAVETLTPLERARLHLGRAAAAGPSLLIVEYPTGTLDRQSVAAFGASLKHVAHARTFGWIVLGDDERFATAVGGTTLTFNPVTGALKERGLLSRWFS